jgi:hypothetical protein
MDWESSNRDIDLWFWVKFIIVGFVLVIVPVWIFNLVDISFLYKILFTAAGGVGLYVGLAKGTMRLRRK